MTETSEPHDDADDPEPPPPGRVSLEELGQQIMLEQLSRSTGRALIEVLAERRDSPTHLLSLSSPSSSRSKNRSTTPQRIS